MGRICLTIAAICLVLLGLSVLLPYLDIAPHSVDAGLPWESPIDKFAIEWISALTSPFTRAILTIMIFFGGYAYVFLPADFGDYPVTGRSILPPEPKAAPPKLALSPAADAASRRVQTALGRLRDMPEGVMTPETQVEYDAILSDHLTGLETAHAKARRAVVGLGPKAAGEADAVFAASLTRLAEKLDDLIEDCGKRASFDLAVQHRFIETRHPDQTGDAKSLGAVE
jgi:hypothetical protein